MLQMSFLRFNFLTWFVFNGSSMAVSVNICFSYENRTEGHRDIVQVLFCIKFHFIILSMSFFYDLAIINDKKVILHNTSGFIVSYILFHNVANVFFYD